MDVHVDADAPENADVHPELEVTISCLLLVHVFDLRALPMQMLCYYMLTLSAALCRTESSSRCFWNQRLAYMTACWCAVQSAHAIPVHDFTRA